MIFCALCFAMRVRHQALLARFKPALRPRLKRRLGLKPSHRSSPRVPAIWADLPRHSSLSRPRQLPRVPPHIHRRSRLPTWRTYSRRYRLSNLRCPIRPRLPRLPRAGNSRRCCDPSAAPRNSLDAKCLRRSRQSSQHLQYRPVASPRCSTSSPPVPDRTQSRPGPYPFLRRRHPHLRR
jgi:hypothetical protein